MLHAALEWEGVHHCMLHLYMHNVHTMHASPPLSSGYPTQPICHMHCIAMAHCTVDCMALVCLSMGPSFCQFLCLSICLLVFLSVCSPVFPSVCLSVSVGLSVCVAHAILATTICCTQRTTSCPSLSACEESVSCQHMH